MPPSLLLPPPFLAPNSQPNSSSFNFLIPRLLFKLLMTGEGKKHQLTSYRTSSPHFLLEIATLALSDADTVAEAYQAVNTQRSMTATSARGTNSAITLDSYYETYTQDQNLGVVRTLREDVSPFFFSMLVKTWFAYWTRL